MLVPIANIVMLLVFAYKEWPIQRELARAPRLGQPDPAGQRAAGYGQGLAAADRGQGSGMHRRRAPG